MWRRGLLPGLLLELRGALRHLARQPRKTVGIVVLLALGLGLNTAIFALVRGVLLKPLPYPEMGSLVAVASTSAELGGAESLVAPLDFMDWKRESKIFQELSALMVYSPVMTGSGEPANLIAAAVTPNFFTALRLQPQMGRYFLEEEGLTGANNVAVLSHSFWQRQLGGSPDVLGRPLTLDGESYTIVGVAPRRHEYPSRRIEIWLPLSFDEDSIGRRRPLLQVMGRLPEGETRESAQAAMSTFAKALEQAYPETNQGRGARVSSLRDSLVAEFRAGLLAVQGAGLLVLFVVCLNVAGLRSAEALKRRKEVILRGALGAGSTRVCLVPGLEAVLLAGGGGLLGLFFAWTLLDRLPTVVPDQVRRIEGVALDAATLGVLGATTALVAVLIGAPSVLDAARMVVSKSRAGLSNRFFGGTAQTTVRRILVVGQVSLALFLLATAGVLWESLNRLRTVPLGFQPENVLVLQLQLSPARYQDPSRRVAFFDRLIAEVKAMPGALAAGAVGGLPLQGGTGGDFELDVEPGKLSENDSVGQRRVYARTATPGYFSTLGIPLRSGRLFEAEDTRERPPVVIVNETLAKSLWGEEDPLGQSLKIHFGPPKLWEVVGVVGDTRYDGPHRAAKPEFFWSYGQFPDTAMSVVIRTAGEPRDLLPQAKEALWRLDRDQPIFRVVTMGELVERSMADRMFQSRLAGLAAVVAVLLAIAGLASLMAQGVEQRRKEIGIRRALGAPTGSVAKKLVQEALALALVGVLLGVGLTFVGGRWLASLLFETPAVDLWTLFGASVILLAGALAGSYLPARRAEAIDPTHLLRQV